MYAGVTSVVYITFSNQTLVFSEVYEYRRKVCRVQRYFIMVFLIFMSRCKLCAQVEMMTGNDAW